MRRLAGLTAALACLAGCAATGVVPARVEDLVDVRWHWVASLSKDAPARRPDPARHWFEAGAAGAIIVQADCNSGLGRRPSVDSPRFGPIALTRRFCGERSLDTAFASALSGVTDASFDAGLLRLSSGETTLLFTRTPDAPLQRYRCPDGPRDLLWSADAAWQVAPERSRRLERTGPRSAARYADAQLTVERDGDTLVMFDRGAAIPTRCGPAPE